MDEMRTVKRDLRQKLLQRQAALTPEYKREASARIFANLLEMEDFQNASRVFLYVGTAKEVDTRPMLEAMLRMGKMVFVPKTITLGHMEACAVGDLSELTPGRHGILEPADAKRAVSPDSLDLILVPCLGFNQRGYRLGYGGGFYDRYLPRVKGKCILLAFEQMREKDLPVEDFDVPCEGILTEEGYRSAEV